MSCPGCFAGKVLEGKPRGKEVVLHGLNTYVSEPEGDPKGIIVIVPDAFGWQFLNNRLLADHYAREGHFLVYLPDFMDGHAASADVLEVPARAMGGPILGRPYNIAVMLWHFIPFIYHTRFKVSMPCVESFMRSVRETAPGSKLPVGAAGFCWGGKHIMTLASGTTTESGQALVDAVYTAHPSQLAVPEDIEAVRKPVSIAIGDKDVGLGMDGPKGVREIEKILNKVGKDHGIKSEVQVYEGAGHGFSIRGDPFNKSQDTQSAEAAKQAVDWFTQNFAGVHY